MDSSNFIMLDDTNITSSTNHGETMGGGVSLGYNLVNFGSGCETYSVDSMTPGSDPSSTSMVSFTPNDDSTSFTINPRYHLDSGVVGHHHLSPPLRFQGFSPSLLEYPTIKPEFMPWTIAYDELRPVSRYEEGMELKIIAEPARNYRARYKTEGSRGAVKDRSGRGYPIVRLNGYNRQPVKLKVFIGHDLNVGVPHLYYQASKIVGKQVTPCVVDKCQGIKIIHIDLLPENGMQAVINCIGIVKERNFDVQQKHLSRKNSKELQKSNSCRLVFQVGIPETQEVLQTVSDPIVCTKILGAPEIHKMSCSKSDTNGGNDLILLGRNFTKDAKVIFEHENWTKVIQPESDFLAHNHLICKVPPFPIFANDITNNSNNNLVHMKLNQIKFTDVQVTLRVKCGDKHSDAVPFSYLTTTCPPIAKWSN